MRSRLTALCLAALATACRTSEPTAVVAVPQSVAPQVTVAFVDVTVVPMDMDAEHTLPHQTVVTAGGHITAMGPVAGTSVPAEAQRIDGGGTLFLIPGLADMHVHLLDDDEMVLNLANGVTTVRNMHGVPSHLAWRDSIARGLKFGPRLYTTGPIIDGSPPLRSTNVVIQTIADADSIVVAQKQQGYDFIKIYNALPRALYEELAAASARQGIRMVGHVPDAVGLDGVLAVGGQYGIEHAEMFLPMTSGGRDLSGLGPVLDGLASKGIWMDPTLAVYDNYVRQMENWTSMISRPEMRYVSPSDEKFWGWFDGNPNHDAPSGRHTALSQGRDFFRTALIPRMRDAGVRLVAGTDAPLPMIVPGYALHDELELLVGAGLTPYQALAAATRNAVAMIGGSATWGTVAVGRDADLVLLGADPLANIANTRRIQGVMTRGRWYPASDLASRLEALAHAYGR